MSATTGLREAHKQTTRRALEDAALRLFARDGFDATTVEAIAEEARVSPRTFFRYFATKDEVLDMGFRERHVRLRAETAGAPTAQPDLDVACAALRVMAAGFEADRDRVLLRARATRTSMVLRGRTADTLAAWEDALAAGLAERRGADRPDPSARVTAAIALAAWRTAFGLWLAESAAARRRLSEHVDEAFGYLLMPPSQG